MCHRTTLYIKYFLSVLFFIRDSLASFFLLLFLAAKWWLAFTEMNLLTWQREIQQEHFYSVLWNAHPDIRICGNRLSNVEIIMKTDCYYLKRRERYLVQFIPTNKWSGCQSWQCQSAWQGFCGIGAKRFLTHTTSVANFCVQRRNQASKIKDAHVKVRR